MKPSPRTNGFVAPGFEEVRAEFERNFAERGEIGAAVAAYWRGEKVVDLWGGRRTPEGDDPWNEDTMVVVMSTTKGLSAMTLALANARGWLDYEAPVASYWPEFAQNGKAEVTVRQLLGHEAGLVLLDEPLSIAKLRDLDYIARVLARQKPAWPPGTRHGYHTLTIGLCMQELIRRVDPDHRSLGRFFHDEIASTLGIDFHIGLPRDIPSERLARIKPLSRWRGVLALRYTPPAVTLKMIPPGSLPRRSFVAGRRLNDRNYLGLGARGNGVGTARASAPARRSPKAAPARHHAGDTGAGDRAAHRRGSQGRGAGRADYFSLGFLRRGPRFLRSTERVQLTGAGGSIGFADPDARLGYAYVMTRLDFYLVNDPREKALRDAVYRAMARLSARARASPLRHGIDPELAALGAVPKRQPVGAHSIPLLDHEPVTLEQRPDLARSPRHDLLEDRHEDAGTSH
jgi:CubicO group peptidase (beta-lactamase class C family)